jgi:excisionase family DNA binding protein
MVQTTHSNPTDDDVERGLPLALRALAERRAAQTAEAAEDAAKSAPTGADYLFGVSAIADYLGVKPRAVYYLIRQQRIPFRKLGGRQIVARKSAIDKALSAEINQAEPPNEPNRRATVLAQSKRRK